MSRLILHIGTPKTGTSAIQRFYKKNTEALHAQGFDFPMFEIKYMNVGQNRNGHFLCKAAQDACLPLRARTTSKEDLEHMFALLASSLKTYDTTILSEESFWACGIRKKRRYWRKVQRLVTAAGAQSIEIVLYIRRQDLFADSRWKQQIKGTTNIFTWREFSTKAISMRLGDYSTGLSYLEDIFGKEHIHVRIFDREKLINGDAVADFSELIGVKLDESFVPLKDQVNTSLSNNLTEIKRISNHALRGARWQRFLYGAAAAASATSKHSQKTSMMTAEQRAAFLDYYKEGNTRIAREYFGDETGELFKLPQDIPVWEKSTQDLLDDTILFFATALADQQKQIARLEKHAGLSELSFPLTPKKSGSKAPAPPSAVARDAKSCEEQLEDETLSLTFALAQQQEHLDYLKKLDMSPHPRAKDSWPRKLRRFIRYGVQGAE